MSQVRFSYLRHPKPILSVFVLVFLQESVCLCALYTYCIPLLEYLVLIYKYKAGRNHHV